MKSEIKMLKDILSVIFAAAMFGIGYFGAALLGSYPLHLRCITISLVGFGLGSVFSQFILLPLIHNEKGQ
jgi:cyanate permease